MIVVDANVFAALYLPGPLTPAALQLAGQEAEWVAPPLLRSELRNILATYTRLRSLDLSVALSILESVELSMSGRYLDVSSLEVLSLAEKSGCTAYDCEYVALAQRLGVPLVTDDAQLLRRFARVAVPLAGRH